eukprot:CAMPEP_0194027226 /NCGR_PEP_ID=MMETSP0009_2-20130614/1398_1 /TAXON_ID=210454 /ORGANISM="Grammatophora oceanica, Strain CCMP 410" /LENGTH=274 /DNA_ID=CAMNT_0038666201 /DNA_START=204 /DNA_END=1028 /DNA_ORIENTATION=-
MPRGVKKEHLPTKVCVTCNRPFTWRKKWEKVWDDVTTCSKSCNRERRSSKQRQNRLAMTEGPRGKSNREARAGDELETTQLKETTYPEAESELEDMEMSTEERKIADTSCRQDGSGVGSVVEKWNESDEQERLAALFSAVLSVDNGVQESDAAAAAVARHQRMVARHEGVEEEDNDLVLDPTAKRNADRKAAKKAKKAARRAQREGKDPEAGRKNCDICAKSVDLLVRCQVDKTLDWKMVCGRCWNDVSGGVVDGDENHPYYRYGGLWKNRRRK